MPPENGLPNSYCILVSSHNLMACGCTKGSYAYMMKGSRQSMHGSAASPEHTCHRAAYTSGPGRAAWERHPPWVGAQSWGQRCTLSTVAHPPPSSTVHLERHAKVCCSLLMHLNSADELVLAVTTVHTECACIHCVHHTACLGLMKLRKGTCWGESSACQGCW